MKPLSKTDFVRGLNCPGEIWLRHHDRSKLPKFSEFVQHRMDQGTLAGELAKKLYPEGIDIKELDLEKSAAMTKEFLPERKVLFEAAFLADNLFSRPDILIPVGKSEWDLIEVKASTEVKKDRHHPEDVAFQKNVCEKAGLKIRKTYLLLLNKEYARHGDIDVNKLFVKEDLTEVADKIIPQLPEKIAFMREILSSPKFPNTQEKNYCEGPKKCDIEECWEFLPESHVFHLYRGGKKSHKLFEEGILKLHEIPDEYKLTERQDLQVRCEKSGETYIEKKKIKEFLKMEEPLCYLDFETIQFAIPRFDNSRPWQQIPFQFSLHVGGKHLEFLHDDTDDPRPAFLTELKKMLPDKGSIVVFNETFELKRLEELGRDFPEYKKWIDSVLERVVDLAVPFSKFWYYNPKQKGSYGLKKVLPAVTGKDYSKLEIQDGGCAAIKYLEMISSKGKEREKLRKNLLAYCGLDTEAMVLIVEELGKFS